ncbi:MAG: hypothetical protein JO009_09740, partial [Candidatus Eremiobacteraeota bacterium]|nr:hypothetical protein [Candidatus Eremiobacteraeota bacterium]
MMTDQQQVMPAWWRQLTRPLVFLIAIVLGIYILRRIPMTIEVFIVATLIAYGINPLIHAMARRMPRVVAVIIVYSVFLILLLVAA